ncbi:vasotab [Achroia grisella]|uniref:vasotab n=1 Tax=Achroia grisella TaxID=688607 RepID=UPI0027D27E21|nr:vasotab [Achroia grisella]
MKAAVVLVLAVLLVAVSCRPDKTDLKQLKAEAARKKACLQDCTSVKVEPLCAGKNGAKSLSFGSECVLHNYNCENKDSFTKVSNGQCPGSDGIRLS